MKKALVVFIIILIINLGCKKRMCACDIPESEPKHAVSLVIKSANGEDVLNPSSLSYAASNTIELYQKDANNVNKSIKFTIQSPFSYNVNSKFEFYQFLFIETPITGNNIYYLKIGSQAPIELKTSINSSTKLIDKVQVANKDLATESVASRTIMFYLNL